MGIASTIRKAIELGKPARAPKDKAMYQGSTGSPGPSAIPAQGVKGKLVSSQDFMSKPIKGYGSPSQSAAPPTSVG